MITVIYDAKNGIPFRDGEVDEYIDCLIEDLINHDNLQEPTFEITIATDNFLEAIRLAVRQRRIPFMWVRLMWYPADQDPYIIEIDPNGNLSEWPEGFADYTQNIVARLVDW
jgi:hypothetical protein